MYNHKASKFCSDFQYRNPSPKTKSSLQLKHVNLSSKVKYNYKINLAKTAKYCTHKKEHDF